MKGISKLSIVGSQCKRVTTGKNVGNESYINDHTGRSSCTNFIPCDVHIETLVFTVSVMLLIVLEACRFY